MWSRQCDRADLPDTLMKSFVSADPDSFPNIIILLVLRCTLLATSAEQLKRSFFVLRGIKKQTFDEPEVLGIRVLYLGQLLRLIQDQSTGPRSTWVS